MYRILIADDEPRILEGLRHVIDWDEHGIEIIGLAQNGEEAYRLLAESPADILLTDVRMPNTDGLQLIKRLKADRRNIHFIILSGYDDFAYIKEAVKLGIDNYLLKPVNQDELSSTLLATIEKIDSEHFKSLSDQQSLDIFRENMLLRWATGSISDEELMEKAGLAGVFLDIECYACAIIHVFNASPDRQKCADAAALVKNLCLGTSIRETQYYTFSDGGGNVLLLFGGSAGELTRHALKEFLKNCVERINETLSCDAFVTLGGTMEGFRRVHESHGQAAELQRYSLILPINIIVDYYESIRTMKNHHKKISADFPAFGRMLSAQSESECLKFVNDLFDSLRSLSGITPKFVQNVLFELLFQMTNVVWIRSERPDLFGIDYSEAYSIGRLDELEQWVILTLGKTFDYLATHEYDCSPYIKNVLSYVNENYLKDLSIKQLSHLFNINAAYLGQLFKNSTGDLFSDYINKARIEKAKELLKTTNMKTTEVSMAVGYPTVNYFYKVFKRYTGISPTEYR